VAGAVPAGGSVVSPLVRFFFFFLFEKTIRRELILPLDAYPLMGVPRALGEDVFAGTAGLRGHHRELPLGEGFTERKDPFGESNLPLGEGVETGSGW
jgi:hypothetical protein